jgi:hypothetical protein
MPMRHQAPPTFARTARIRLPLLVLRRSDCRSRVRVVGRRRSAQAKQAIESLVPAAARCGSPGQTIPLPDPAGPRNLALGTGIRRRGQLRPRPSPDPAGPCPIDPKEGVASPGPRNPASPHDTWRPPLPSHRSQNPSPDRRSSAMNSGNREILRYGRKQLVMEMRRRPFRGDA